MAVLKLSTPGVYVQEISTLPPSVAEVETAIPAFIGYTEKAMGPTGNDLTWIPTKITDPTQYTLYFGTADKQPENSISIDVTVDGSGSATVTVKPGVGKKSEYNLAYAIQHFFDNGGGACYIVSVGKYTAAPGTIASDDLKKGLDQVKDVDEVTLLVIPEAQVSDNHATLCKELIKQAADLKDRFALIDPAKVTPKTASNPAGAIDADVKLVRDNTLGPEMDRYAAAYYPNLVTSYGYNFTFDDLTIDTYTGPAPDLKDKKISDNTVAGLGNTSVLYGKVKAAVGKYYVELPPSAAIAGLYARIDASKGVWKAPANETLLSVTSPSIPISSREQENLNIDPNSGKSVNVIRTFPGYGTLVWGARSLNGNDNEWRYISVRRFFNMVEESVKKSSQWAVFEPNTIDTWVKMEAMIRNYLFLKWREGALAGEKEEQAFYVRVGLGKTMTSLDILEGRMNVEIGMAAARPAEFIVLKFSQLVQQS
jgi:phage tail sheath protein FI